jgi:DNA/RNA-binding domain of Phe-tRNA-synthetase-like protein
MSANDGTRAPAVSAKRSLTPRFAEIGFTVDEKVLELGLTGVYFAMGGLVNRLSDDRFEERLNTVVTGLLGRYQSSDDIKSDPVLGGFRELHAAVGRSNRDNIAAPENLLKTLQKRGAVPRVNLLVDIYNMVSLGTRLALGAHDLATVAGDVHLRLTTGEERFVPLGATEPKLVHPGEYAYVDDSNEVICRMETRQVEKTKVDLGTTECFYIVQGNHATDAEYVWRTANELISLTKELCGGDERILFGP